MRIGLITLHCALNYGAVLQAVALYETLESQNKDTELINFRQPHICSIVDHTRKNELKNFKNLLRYIVKGKMIYEKKRNFDLFLSNHISVLTEEFNSRNELINFCNTHVYDLLVCGSDQIWNPYITHFESAFFLKFADRHTRKISYAASIGQDNIQRDGINFIAENIDEMDAISVREESAVNILNRAGVKKPVSVNLDPVFFLDAKEWEKKQIPVKLSMDLKRYILVYRLTDNPLMDKVLNELTEKTGLPCIAITERLGKVPYIKKKFASVGPGEFLYLMNNAEYVVTDSFHGISFSLLFKKRLIAISNLARNTRLVNILSKTEMSECLVNQEKTEHFIPDIDYEEKYKHCMEIIEEERAKNLNFLKTQIGEVKNAK